MTNDSTFLFQAALLLGGLLAGFIDSIAGGGGLITLPLLTVALEAGAVAVGTNKIVGTIGAAVALWVYSRKQPLRVGKALPFLVGIFFGSAMGAQLTPFLPLSVFRWTLISILPVILFFVFKKDTWIRLSQRSHFVAPKQATWPLFFTGLTVGFYDGAFGPGGGTLMLIGLLLVAKLGLIEALLLSKLANTLSAGTALVTFASHGYVHWGVGLTVAAGMALGANAGSRLANRRAELVVRPILVIAVGLLLVKLLTDAFAS
jgi:uncharacterized membrane protein YfcA